MKIGKRGLKHARENENTQKILPARLSPSQTINKQIRPDWCIICETLTRQIIRLQLKMCHGVYTKV